MRDLAIRHPNIFPLVATRHPAAPWLRPPLRNLDMVEEFLDTLLNSGFSQQQAAMVYRTFASFLLGHLLLTAAQEADQGQLHQERPALEDLGDFPRIQAMERGSSVRAQTVKGSPAPLRARLGPSAGTEGDPAPVATGRRAGPGSVAA